MRFSQEAVHRRAAAAGSPRTVEDDGTDHESDSRLGPTTRRLFLVTGISLSLVAIILFTVFVLVPEDEPEGAASIASELAASAADAKIFELPQTMNRTSLLARAPPAAKPDEKELERQRDGQLQAQSAEAVARRERAKQALVDAKSKKERLAAISAKGKSKTEPAVSAAAANAPSQHDAIAPNVEDDDFEVHNVSDVATEKLPNVEPSAPKVVKKKVDHMEETQETAAKHVVSAGNYTPIVIVEEHQDVIKYWYRAVATGRLPSSKVTLVHIDSHPDTRAPDHFEDSFPHLSRWSWNGRNDQFILHAILTGVVGKLIVVTPNWKPVKTVQEEQLAQPSILELGRYTPSPEHTCLCEVVWDPAQEVPARSCVTTVEDFTNGKERVPIKEEQCDVSIKVPMVTMQLKHLSRRVLDKLHFPTHEATNGLIIDVDLDFFAVKPPTFILRTAGAKMKHLNRIDRVISRTFCPLPTAADLGSSEVRHHTILFRLVRLVLMSKKSRKGRSLLRKYRRLLGRRKLGWMGAATLCAGVTRRQYAVRLKKLISALGLLPSRALRKLLSIGFCFRPLHYDPATNTAQHTAADVLGHSHGRPRGDGAGDDPQVDADGDEAAHTQAEAEAAAALRANDLAELASKMIAEPTSLDLDRTTLAGQLTAAPEAPPQTQDDEEEDDTAATKAGPAAKAAPAAEGAVGDKQEAKPSSGVSAEDAEEEEEEDSSEEAVDSQGSSSFLQLSGAWDSFFGSSDNTALPPSVNQSEYPVSAFATCRGYNDESTASEIHVPSRARLAKVASLLGRRLEQLAPPSLITISRSVRDGFMPGPVAREAEKQLISALQLPDRKYEKFVGIDVLGGEAGWPPRIRYRRSGGAPATKSKRKLRLTRRSYIARRRSRRRRRYRASRRAGGRRSVRTRVRGRRYVSRRRRTVAGHSRRSSRRYARIMRERPLR